jgi:2,3-bisphosphoglycerate-dependent phosphoglycerate mutase
MLLRLVSRLLLVVVLLSAPAVGEARPWRKGALRSYVTRKLPASLQRLFRGQQQQTATLVLVRHGQSLWNLQNRFTGWVDVPLTTKGRAEARRAGQLVKGLGVRMDRAYTSGLQRAQESLRLMMDSSGQKLPVTASRALNERHYGYLQGLSKDLTAKRLGQELVHTWRRSWDVAPPGGESLEMTAERAMPYFEGPIMRDLRRGKNVLVVAHGNSLRAIVKSLDGLSPAEVTGLQLETGVPLVYKIDPRGRVVSKSVLGK